MFLNICVCNEFCLIAPANVKIICYLIFIYFGAKNKMRTYTRKRPDHQLIENVHELCRLCLSKADSDVPIFTEDANSGCAVLALRIMICVGLEMKQEDCLPNLLCTECLNSLNKCYAFRKKCEVSYQKLKSHVLAVKENQYKIKMEEEKKARSKTEEADEQMKFVVTFDREQAAEVSLLNLDGVASVNNFKEKSLDVKNTDNAIEESDQNQIQETVSPEPNITTFLSTVLLQLGILRQNDNGLVFAQQSINTLELETGDGSQITLELVEEDETAAVEEPTVNRESLDNTEETKPLSQNSFLKYITPTFTTQTPKEKPIKNNLSEAKKNGTWCDECGKQLASRSALTRHRRVHSGEKPYACRDCGRRFGQREVMLRHALVHEEQRPYACEVCSKSFTQRGALQSHARAHAPAHARPLAIHRCSRCPKVFLYASGLSRHMMMHAGRVYVCGACERQFKDKSSLMRHLRNNNHANNTIVTTTT